MTQTINLSSNASSTLVVSPTAYMYDTTTLVIVTSAIYLDKPLLSMTINWGDNTASEFYSNDFFPDETNNLTEIAFGYDYNIIRLYQHQYSPSSTALTRILSAQILARYYDDTACRFVIPINITNPSIINKVGDLSVMSANSLNLSNDYLISLHTSKGGFIIDTVLSV